MGACQMGTAQCPKRGRRVRWQQAALPAQGRVRACRAQQTTSKLVAATEEDKEVGEEVASTLLATAADELRNIQASATTSGEEERAGAAERALTIVEGISGDLSAALEAMQSRMRFEATVGMNEDDEAVVESIGSTLEDMVASTFSIEAEAVYKEVTMDLGVIEADSRMECEVLSAAFHAAADAHAPADAGTVAVEQEWPLVKSSRSDRLSPALQPPGLPSLLWRPNGAGTTFALLTLLSSAFDATVGVAFTFWFSSTLMGFFGLRPTLEETLHWQALLPTPAAAPLVAWTLPLMAACAALAFSRERYQRVVAMDGEASKGGLLKAGAIAADLLQRGNRAVSMLPTMSTGTKLGSLAFFTFTSCTVNGIWMYGVLPPIVAKGTGILTAPDGDAPIAAALRSLVEAPIVAVAVGLVTALAVLADDALDSSADASDGDGDIQINSSAPVTTKATPSPQEAYAEEVNPSDTLFENAGVHLSFPESGKLRTTARTVLGTSLESAQAGGQEVLKKRVTGPAVGDLTGIGLRQAAKRPAVVSVSTKLAYSLTPISAEQSWVKLSATFAIVSYLALEALVTHEVAFSIATEAIALLTMDAIASPLRCASTTWTAAAVPVDLLPVRQRVLSKLEE